MKTLQDRLAVVERHVKEKAISIMIIGLGSVGTYLLDYLVSRNDEAIKVVVVGRNREKMEKNVNIVRVAALIRGLNKTVIEIQDGVDLTNVLSIQSAIEKHKPDFIVNTSRAYPGLKYGSISWANVRAYGIWTPLAIRFAKNVMEACDKAETDAIVINASYSDAVIPWLKSAGKAYPDFGSGNLNHLVPRIKFAVAEIIGVNDFWNVEVMFAAGHFHDVVISKEGHTEGVKLLLSIKYQGKELDVNHDDVYKACGIPMPTDQKRNMMNASSNFDIIYSILSAIREKKAIKIHTPGVDGHIGGYPYIIDATDEEVKGYFYLGYSMEEMEQVNRNSIYCDGIENVEDGCLVYTDELIDKVKDRFNVEIPKKVMMSNADVVANLLIDGIIIPNCHK